MIGSAAGDRRARWHRRVVITSVIKCSFLDRLVEYFRAGGRAPGAESPSLFDPIFTLRTFSVPNRFFLTVNYKVYSNCIKSVYFFVPPPSQKCAFLSYDTVVWSSHLAELVKSSLARPHPDHFLNVFCTTGSWMILCLLRGHAALGAVHVMCHAFFHEAK